MSFENIYKILLEKDRSIRRQIMQEFTQLQIAILTSGEIRKNANNEVQKIVLPSRKKCLKKIIVLLMPQLGVQIPPYQPFFNEIMVSDVFIFL